MTENDIPFPEILHPREVSVATTTYYSKWYKGRIQEENKVDKIRGDLALNTVKEALSNGYHLTVVDGGSSSDFVTTVKATGATVIAQEKKGMSPSRMQAFKKVVQRQETKVICWTEPEKPSFIKDGLSRALGPIQRGEADIVIPGRNLTLWKETYPDYQVASEQNLNHEFSNLLRKYKLIPTDHGDIDVSFGPRLFINDPKVTELFLREYSYKPTEVVPNLLKPDLWQNATFLPIINALHKGLKVATVVVPYSHPKKQTEIENENPEYLRKRTIQFRQIILTSRHLLRQLSGDKKGRLEQKE